VRELTARLQHANRARTLDERAFDELLRLLGPFIKGACARGDRSLVEAAMSAVKKQNRLDRSRLLRGEAAGRAIAQIIEEAFTITPADIEAANGRARVGLLADPATASSGDSA
jgi:hypothetical protein